MVKKICCNSHWVKTLIQLNLANENLFMSSPVFLCCLFPIEPYFRWLLSQDSFCSSYAEYHSDNQHTQKKQRHIPTTRSICGGSVIHVVVHFVCEASREDDPCHLTHSQPIWGQSCHSYSVWCCVQIFPKLKCPSRALCSKFRWTKCCSPSDSREKQCPFERVPGAVVGASTCPLSGRDGSDGRCITLYSPIPASSCSVDGGVVSSISIKGTMHTQTHFSESSYAICVCTGGGKRIASGCESDGCHVIIWLSCWSGLVTDNGCGTYRY